MSGTTPSLRHATAEFEELRKRFGPVFDKIAEGNLEREKGRVFPYEQVRWLIDARFGAVRIPRELGGFGASLQQTFRLLRELGAADPNVAHVWRNHLAFVEDRLYAPRTPATDAWIERFLGGDFVGGGWTEANNGTYANIQTKLAREGDHWVLTGAKFYATGSLYADWLDVLAVTPDGVPTTALVKADQPGVSLADDWKGFGQKTTASGSATYTGARVEDENVFPASERFSYQGLFYQTALLAVLAGITEATLRDGVAALKRRKRNYGHGLAEVATADPQLLQVIGKVSAASFGAESALSAQSAVLDEIAGARIAGDEETERRRLVEGHIATSRAQLVIIEAALQATTVVFDALGSSGVSEDLLLDRHWRNARTLASHNPRVYKERIVGDWHVNQADPTALFAIPAGQSE
ncbi:alkylation response protein AidB-like acyl-CoA dehydrogenase [Thermocatellispora tengchongensis]|uniref:Dibenzothiophene monooxygenase n=1 Tax=Thermocatellispora tengchongensis TaxID=1073253 RepID=A0A840P4F4_9ACTN|nr:acyl-CoA dehydrogenase family protein [Thermocatellispora tengchongensis]MBB5133386.1 alkylation response protein AidB-like acyl-CoA dehydrogenase [Thermocatellispora tengchongensis]